VGERLARLALNNTYSMSHVAQYGPSVSRVTASKGKIIIEFDNADVLTTSDGAPLRGLQIAPSVGTFIDVQQQDIEIEGNRIIIGNAKGCVRVRYAWTPYTDANLINAAGLPASTFEAAVTDENK
jgi:sialate O-acetylesterase